MIANRPVVALLAVAVGVGAWAWWDGSVGPVTVRPHCTAVANGESAELSPEQAGNAAVIAGIAQRRGLPARAASIGIATAIQESKLRNIDYGDRDSIGLFQQRPSQGWGSVAEIMDPIYSTNAFFDALTKVEGFVDMEITEVAQEVQKSAFPDAYADHEPEARIIASALSGYSPAGLTCELRSPGAAPDPEGGDSTATAAVAAAARAEKGGSSPTVSDDGRLLTFRTAGPRQAWALAAWAVARADGLDITTIAVGDRVWDRAQSQQGWRPATAVPGGAVRISVA